MLGDSQALIHIDTCRTYGHPARLTQASFFMSTAFFVLYLLCKPLSQRKLVLASFLSTLPTSCWILAGLLVTEQCPAMLHSNDTACKHQFAATLPFTVQDGKMLKKASGE